MTKTAHVTSGGKRGDVQGLRALAVIAVVADHAVHAPAGGFVGVDVFFVISGFLITGLMLREHHRTGRISLVGFYARRLRRIAPAALVVLAVTVAGAFLLYGPGRALPIVRDALASAGFVANWRFAALGTDYFQADGPTSPLQHYWSLSVEEQFYLVWPLLLVTMLGFVRRRRRGGRPFSALPLVVVALLGSASFTWALSLTASAPTQSYFSTFARAWELAAGAALAMVAHRLERLPSVARTIAGWAGLVVIIGSIGVIDGTRAFPAPLGLVPVVGAMLVIASGCGRAGRGLVLLDNRAMRFVGDASYSVYLWHFPVLVLGGPLVAFLLGASDPSAAGCVAILLVATAVLSVASWRYIEQPVLRSRWLLPKQASGMRAYRRRIRRPFLLTGAAVVLCVATVGAAWGNDGFGGGAAGMAGAAETQARPSTPSANGNAPSGGDDAQAALTASISQALAARSWPSDLQPAVADVANEVLPGNTAKCGSIAWLPAADCTFGSPNAAHRAVLVGDSIAQAYVPALATLLGSGSWSLRITSMYACPFIDHEVGVAAAAANACKKRRDQEVQAVTEMKPDLLIVASTYWRGADTATGRAVTFADWHAGFEAAMRRVVPAAARTVVISPPPYDKDIRSCYSAFAGPSACVSSALAANSTWSETLADQQRSATSLHYDLIDARPWFCSAQGQCPAFVGNLLTKKDQAHPTALYVEHLVPVIREALVRAGVPELVTAATPGP